MCNIQFFSASAKFFLLSVSSRIDLICSDWRSRQNTVSKDIKCVAAIIKSILIAKRLSQWMQKNINFNSFCIVDCGSVTAVSPCFETTWRNIILAWKFHYSSYYKLLVQSVTVKCSSFAETVLTINRSTQLSLLCRPFTKLLSIC